MNFRRPILFRSIAEGVEEWCIRRTMNIFRRESRTTANPANNGTHCPSVLQLPNPLLSYPMEAL